MKAKNSLFAVALLTLALALSVACTKPAKSDAQLSGEVQNKITSDGSLQGKQIAVQSSNGVVTLSGTVASDAERSAASNDAAQVEGVRQVLNNLTVAQAQQPAQQP